MQIRLLLIAILLIGIGTSPTSAQKFTGFDPANSHYIWPTNASPYLSSTFGETRSTHFHAALDIKTWGRRGYEVYATRDGVVDRIAIGPRGYGKVVYLKHDDGSYSVYAHLLSFNNKLQQLADSVRFVNDYQFEIEKFWGWRNITVEKGDVIGYSGASGIGPPHLHFELRTPSHKPFNPLLTNLSIDDNIPPTIRELSIEPLSKYSTIDGENKIFTKRAQYSGGSYNFGTISVSGPIGLGVNAFDQSNRVNNSYAVYELILKVNGEQFFSAKVDSFSYNETDQMFIDRVYPILNKKDKGYQRLYLADGNTLPFYQTNGQKGKLDLPTGHHKITIIAKDFYGNTSTANLQLQVDKNSNSDLASSHPNNIREPNNLSIDEWNWFSNWVTIPHNDYRHVTLGNTDHSSYIPHSNGIAIDLREKRTLFINTPLTGPFSLYRVNPGKTSFISTADFRHFAKFPRETTYDTVSVAMTVKEDTSNSITVDLIPGTHPLKNEFTFHIARRPSLQDTSKFSFYNWDQEDNEWEYIPTKFDNHFIIGKTETFGHFTLKKDQQGPQIGNPRLRQRADGKWIILIDAIDNLSGINYHKSKITVDGVRGIAEFEPEDDRFVYYHPYFKPSANMDIDVVAYDKMGNKTEQTFQLQSDEAKK